MTATDEPHDQTREVSLRLRELAVQLSLLNHRLAARVNLQDVDLHCLDLISRHGPLTPSALAKQAGLRPATTTGVLDRLENAGWINRERVPTDRRALHLTVKPERATELSELLAPILSEITRICDDMDQTQRATITDFLTRLTTAGHDAAETLAQ